MSRTNSTGSDFIQRRAETQLERAVREAAPEVGGGITRRIAIRKANHPDHLRERRSRSQPGASDCLRRKPVAALPQPANGDSPDVKAAMMLHSKLMIVAADLEANHGTDKTNEYIMGVMSGDPNVKPLPPSTQDQGQEQSPMDFASTARSFGAGLMAKAKAVVRDVAKATERPDPEGASDRDVVYTSREPRRDSFGSFKGSLKSLRSLRSLKSLGRSGKRKSSWKW